MSEETPNKHIVQCNHLLTHSTPDPSPDQADYVQEKAMSCLEGSCRVGSLGLFWCRRLLWCSFLCCRLFDWCFLGGRSCFGFGDATRLGLSKYLRLINDGRGLGACELGPECGEAWTVLTGAAAVLAVFLVRGFAVLALVAVLVVVAFLVAGAFLVVVAVAAAAAAAVFVLFFGAAFFAVVVVLGLVSLVSFYHVVSKEWR